MFRRIGIRSLTIAFAVLLVIVVLVKVEDNRRGDNTFNSELTNFSVNNVTAIELKPKSVKGGVIRFEKNNKHWTIVYGGKILKADDNVVIRMLSAISHIKARSLVSTSRERYKEYEVTDSLGTKVTVFNGKKKLADLVLGKFAYSKPRSLTTYVRMESNGNVYGVEGYLPMIFNRKINDFRDHRLVSMVSSEMKKLAFHYANGKSFVLENNDGKWQVNGMRADSAKVATYLLKIGNLKGTNFINLGDNESAPLATVDITRKQEQPVVTVTAYQNGKDKVLTSSQNPSAFFNDKKLYDSVFVPAIYFKH